MAGLVWFFIAVLVVIWAMAALVHVGGGLVHLLAVAALVLFVYNLFIPRGTSA